MSEFGMSLGWMNGWLGNRAISALAEDLVWSPAPLWGSTQPSVTLAQGHPTPGGFWDTGTQVHIYTHRYTRVHIIYNKNAISKELTWKCAELRVLAQLLNVFGGISFLQPKLPAWSHHFVLYKRAKQTSMTGQGCTTRSCSFITNPGAHRHHWTGPLERPRGSAIFRENTQFS